MTIDEDQHHQLLYKKLPQVIQFFDEQGQQITYKINHEDAAANSCIDFYPIYSQQGKDQKILRLYGDVENFPPNIISTDLATSSVQLAAQCFGIRKTKNHFLRLCRPQSSKSASPSESSNGTYSSISVTETDGTADPLQVPNN